MSYLSPQLQSNERLSSRFRSQIVGGIFVPFSEISAWLKRTHNINLATDHSEDLTIIEYLLELFDNHSYPVDVRFAEGQDPVTMDLLLVSQKYYGQFRNIAPAGEEVIQEGLKDVLKPGELDRGACEILLKELGFNAEFKCFFSNV